MRLNPKEFLSIVAGTVLVLVAISTVAGRPASSDTPNLRTPELARCEMECEIRS